MLQIEQRLGGQERSKMRLVNDAERLAEADGHVSLRYIDCETRVPQPLIDLMSSEEFEVEKRNSKSLKELTDCLNEIYAETKRSGFLIKPDRFGGFGLFNCSGKTLKEGCVLDFPVGVLRKLPPNKITRVNNTSIIGGKRDRDDKVLAGTLRWINHSCVPNVDYYMGKGFQRESCIRVRTLRPIAQDEELLVYYSEHFFGVANENCQCGHSLHDTHDQHYDATRSSHSVSSPGKNLLSYSRSICRLNGRPKHMRRLRNFVGSTVAFSSPIEVDEANDTTHKLSIDEPIESVLEADTCVQSIHSDNEMFFETASDAETPNYGNFSSKLLLPGGFAAHNSQNTVNNVSLSALALVCRHNGSDELLKDIVKRDKLLLSLPNAVQSPYGLMQIVKSACSKVSVTEEPNSEGILYCLDFVALLKQTVVENFEAMVEYSKSRRENSDLKLHQFFPVDDSKVTVKLILNTDGAQLIKSSTESAWPVWASLADLPPILRSAFKYITLCCLWYGRGKPDWDKVWTKFLESIGTEFEFDYKDQTVRAKLRVILVVADLPAKASLLCHKKCNGFYGCSLCEVRGEHVLGAHTYPLEPILLRTPESYAECIRQVLDGSKEKRKSAQKRDPEKFTKGVKGESQLLKVIQGLPLTAPIDTMHQLFLGVANTFLTHCYVRLKLCHRKELDSAISSIKFTKEIKRKLKPLKDNSRYKASEWKTLLFYVAPILLPAFLGSEDMKVYRRNLMRLVFATRQLYESCNKADVCGFLLERFCSSVVRKLKDKKFSGINFHSLRHLAWQVENIGPLWTTSAFGFESANNQLLMTFTGNKNFGDLLVKRYIRNREIIRADPQDDQLTDFIHSLRPSGFVKFSKENLVSETIDVIEARQKYPDARYFGRLQNEFFFDSVCYKRGGADSYVCWTSTDGEIRMGKILVFVEPKSESTFAVVQRFEEVRQIGNSRLNSSLGYVAQETEEKSEVGVAEFQWKLLRIDFRGETFLVKLLQHFEHD